MDSSAVHSKRTMGTKAMGTEKWEILFKHEKKYTMSVKMISGGFF